MLFLPLGVAYAIDMTAFRHQAVVSVTKKVRTKVMKLFQALPRRVHSDDDLSTVSALSIDATFDEYIDCDTDNFIIAQTSDWSHHNDDEDDASFLSCNSMVHEVWRSTVSEFTFKDIKETERDFCSKISFIGYDDFSKTLEVVPTFCPIIRMVCEVRIFLFGLSCDVGDSDEPSAFEIITQIIPVIEDCEVYCHNGDVACLYVLHNKKSYFYQFFKQNYRITKMVFNLKRRINR